MTRTLLCLISGLVLFVAPAMAAPGDVVLNGTTYNASQFTANGGYGYVSLFPTPILSDMLAEIDTRLAQTGNTLVASSTTSLAVGTGNKSLTIEAGRGFAAGQWVAVVKDTDNYMIGTVTAHDPETGALTVDIPANHAVGSGTYATWSVVVSGLPLPASSAGPTFVTSPTVPDPGAADDTTKVPNTAWVWDRLDTKQGTITGAATSIADSDLTASRALVSDASGKVAASSVTAAELDKVGGATANLQTQINNIVAGQLNISGSAQSVDTELLTANRALVTDGSQLIAASTVTSTELGTLSGIGSTPISSLLAGKQSTVTGGASSITTNNLATNRALISDSSGKVAASSVTSTDLANFPTQISGKQATITGGASSITTNNLATNRALLSDGAGKVAASSVTATELSRLAGIEEGVQAQLNTKASTALGTTSTAGLVELATDAEVAAGTDTDRAITPAGLFSSLARYHFANGYQRLPGGLIIQWGVAADTSNDSSVNTFPLQFTTAVYAVVLTENILGNAGSPWTVGSVTTQQFEAQRGTTGGAETAYYIAVGK